MIEEWRPIPSFPKYEASSLGRVRRTGSLVPLKASPSKKGYLRVCVYRHWRKPQARHVHTLICEAFHGPKPAWASECAHGDNHKNNNRSSNLRWATHDQNVADGTLLGPLVGEDAPNAILTKKQVAEIRSRHAAAQGAKRVKRGTRGVLAAEFGVSKRTIDAVVRRENWA